MKQPFLIVTGIMTVLVSSSSEAKASPTKLTGQYEYKHGAQHSSLYVKELPGHNIKFAITSEWIGNVATGNVHTGQAAATIPVKRDAAVYHTPEMTLTLNFTPARCKVGCDHTNFYGGMNVDPNGIYKKVNSKSPSEKDLMVD